VGENTELTIGINSNFSGVSIFCATHIVIGEYCNYRGVVSIWDTDFHPINYMTRSHHTMEFIRSRETIVHDDVWIGADSIILKGSFVGSRSIAAAGSVGSGRIPHDLV
jgi:acetyltransferase-like isoleucine patch superfamily enzyme